MLEETTTGTSLSRKATLLISEVLDVANRTLPMAVAAQIQVRLVHFNLASSPNLYYVCLDNTSGLLPCCRLLRARAPDSGDQCDGCYR